MIDLAKPTEQFCWDAHVLGTAYDMFADAWIAERRAVFEKFLERYMDMGLKLFRKTKWKVVSFSGEAKDGPVRFALDEDPKTVWPNPLNNAQKEKKEISEDFFGA